MAAMPAGLVYKDSGCCVDRGSIAMKLVVAMPALNEEATIEQVIAAVPRSIPGIDSIWILVIDDGSTDRTVGLAKQAGAVVVSHGDNRGVGASFQTAVRKALELGVDVMVNIDADGQFDPADIPKLVRPIVADEYDFVTASRFKDKSLVPEMDRIKLFGNKLMSVLVNRLTGKRFHDVSCGFRAYNRDVLLRMNLFGEFTYTQETLLNLSFNRARMLEVPIRVRGRRKHGKSRVASNLWRYGWQANTILFRTFGDYRPLNVFGAIAGVFSIAGAALGVFLLTHYILVGTFSPHKWAGFTSAFLLSLGLLVGTTGMLADMLARIRMNQERLLYLSRKRTYRKSTNRPDR
jgi:glycosyltransferase involved in cell wall biosynthesis